MTLERSVAALACARYFKFTGFDIWMSVVLLLWVVIGPVLLDSALRTIDPVLATSLAWADADGGPVAVTHTVDFRGGVPVGERFDPTPRNLTREPVIDPWGRPIQWRIASTEDIGGLGRASSVRDLVAASQGPSSEDATDDIEVLAAEAPRQDFWNSIARHRLVLSFILMGFWWSILRLPRLSRRLLEVILVVCACVPVVPIAWIVATRESMLARESSLPLWVPLPVAVMFGVVLCACTVATAVRLYSVECPFTNSERGSGGPASALDL